MMGKRSSHIVVFTLLMGVLPGCMHVTHLSNTPPYSSWVGKQYATTRTLGLGTDRYWKTWHKGAAQFFLHKDQSVISTSPADTVPQGTILRVTQVEHHRLAIDTEHLYVKVAIPRGDGELIADLLIDDRPPINLEWPNAWPVVPVKLGDR